MQKSEPSPHYHEKVLGFIVPRMLRITPSDDDMLAPRSYRFSCFMAWNLLRLSPLCGAAMFQKYFALAFLALLPSFLFAANTVEPENPIKEVVHVKERVFISGVQKELADERRAAADFVRNDPLLHRFFDVFLFEELPASDCSAEEAYIAELDRASVYIGLFGNKYGWEDDQGISPTEREFAHATTSGIVRLVFVKGESNGDRHPKIQALIDRAGSELIRRRFSGVADLVSTLYASLVEHLERTGRLRTRPFDASACPNASFSDIADDKLKWFLGMARRERQYPLREDTPITEALAHLNLLDAGQPTYASILLYGKQPQRFLPSSEVKCLHFHGVNVQKPIPSYQIYKGTVFELVDQAVDFVMSKIARSVGTRALGPQVPVEYELPREAVAEAIVNAITHRDYASNASVQVMLFADRLEIWNPGELPPSLTFKQLRHPHASIPRNPLIAEPIFLAHYIEKAGTGTLDMIALCRAAGLAEPSFRQDGGQFVLTLWRPAPQVTTQVAMQVTTQVEAARIIFTSHDLKEVSRALNVQTEQMTQQITQQVFDLLEALGQEAKSREELGTAAGLLNREHFRKAYLEPLLTAGWIERTIPDKPTSRLQKYVITEKGQSWLMAVKKNKL